MSTEKSPQTKKSNKNAEQDTTSVAVQDESRGIDLSQSGMIDTTGLDSETIGALKIKEADAKIEIQKKAQEAQLDLQATKVQLDTLNDTVRDATREGTSATITHTQSTSVGRTEVVMGNTERAASGKMSRSAAGLPDNTMKLLIVGGIIAAVVVLIVVSGQ
jgi:hypothetical protein